MKFRLIVIRIYGISIFIKIIMFCNQSRETFGNVSFNLSIVGSNYRRSLFGPRTVKKLSKINR